ncbi:translesion error-prone DNA polymerase V autoproteolytic subunit [Lichenihabitans sp. Uapishka_5]|uniref:LexA family protein n=1 Tax=Lichenihabitans sp. Uapishka_5 TaxID=3037302 RepID=UPI0029E7EAFE|nr:translesion error-prone DNA polymerase V autoproteolytic subunit [Lichenihabitans sp. Uapishka_5]MDX7951787.1 translesion error-prone DNA polymerase V autoproteolytic subunit [Lichenihabitans sp. Uapishka_5]
MRASYRHSRKGIGGRPRGAPTTVVRLPLPVAAIAKRLADGSLRAGDLASIFSVEAYRAATVPLVMSPASCGFPSPADDYLDRPLDFNELLISNPSATFAVKIAGESMKDAGIFPGDLAIVDRSVSAWNGCVVLALLHGEFTIKRYRKTVDGIVLHPENKAFRDIIVGEDSGFEVWGVVRNTIRML